jgi:hypothetical protein
LISSKNDVFVLADSTSSCVIDSCEVKKKGSSSCDDDFEDADGTFSND